MYVFLLRYLLSHHPADGGGDQLITFSPNTIVIKPDAAASKLAAGNGSIQFTCDEEIQQMQVQILTAQGNTAPLSGNLLSVVNGTIPPGTSVRNITLSNIMISTGNGDNGLKAYTPPASQEGVGVTVGAGGLGSKFKGAFYADVSTELLGGNKNNINPKDPDEGTYGGGIPIEANNNANLLFKVQLSGTKVGGANFNEMKLYGVRQGIYRADKNCTVERYDANVSLAKTTELSIQNGSAPEQPFSIQLKCPTNAPIKVAINDAVDMANNTSALKLALVGNQGWGIGIRRQDNRQLVKLQEEWSVTPLSDNSVPLQFAATYVKTSGPIIAGKNSAQATFTFTIP